MSKQTENYIGSQQHWEDRINDDYDYLKQMEKKMEKDVEKLIYNRLEKRNKMILTPKQKAYELHTFYQNVVRDIGGELVRTIPVFERAKECALFTANQCQKELEEIGHYDYFYWKEVKQEIQNL